MGSFITCTVILAWLINGPFYFLIAYKCLLALTLKLVRIEDNNLSVNTECVFLLPLNSFGENNDPHE
jgi:hypothetical protein